MLVQLCTHLCSCHGVQRSDLHFCVQADSGCILRPSVVCNLLFGQTVPRARVGRLGRGTWDVPDMLASFVAAVQLLTRD